MDEPLAALDAARKAEILPAIERLNALSGIAIVYVSHAIAEVARLADHVVLMEAGRAVASGAGRRAAEPPRPAAAARRGRRRRAAGRGRRARRRVAPGPPRRPRRRVLDPRPALPVGHRIRLRVLARDVSLSLVEQPGSSIVNQIAARWRRSPTTRIRRRCSCACARAPARERAARARDAPLRAGARAGAGAGGVGDGEVGGAAGLSVLHGRRPPPACRPAATKPVAKPNNLLPLTLLRSLSAGGKVQKASANHSQLH